MRMLCTNGVKTVVEEVLPGFERTCGATVEPVFASTNLLLERIKSGETGDLAILTAEAIDELVAQGRIVAGSRVDLARSAIGIAKRQGAPSPDIGTVDALRQTLVQARAVAYSKTGVSGVYMRTLLERLGIADRVAPKAVIPETGTVGEAVARGDAEIAVQQISELMGVPGTELVGPLPGDAQKLTVFSAGIFSAAADPDIARTLVEALTSNAVRPLYAKKGLEPAQ